MAWWRQFICCHSAFVWTRIMHSVIYCTSVREWRAKKRSECWSILVVHSLVDRYLPNRALLLLMLFMCEIQSTDWISEICVVDHISAHVITCWTSTMVQLYIARHTTRKLPVFIGSNKGSCLLSGSLPKPARRHPLTVDQHALKLEWRQNMAIGSKWIIGRCYIFENIACFGSRKVLRGRRRLRLRRDEEQQYEAACYADRLCYCFLYWGSCAERRCAWNSQVWKRVARKYSCEAVGRRFV